MCVTLILQNYTSNFFQVLSFAWKVLFVNVRFLETAAMCSSILFHMPTVPYKLFCVNVSKPTTPTYAHTYSTWYWSSFSALSVHQSSMFGMNKMLSVGIR